jgi:8-oxo-dGTP pyrophosphatase MutT (NUDIX family)
VVLPLIDVDPPSLLFTRRSDAVRTHKGEVSFPGGARHDEDPDLLATGLRETEEELGIAAASLEVLGALPWTPTFVSGFVVVPFVARLPERPELTPSAAEVAEVLELDLGRLARIESVEQREWRGAAYDTHTYRLDGHTVWGVTGRILHSMLEMLKREGWTWRATS